MDIQLLTTGEGEQGIGLQEDSLGGTESVAPLREVCGKSKWKFNGVPHTYFEK